MGYNQPMQSNPQEHVVQVPLDIEPNQTTPINHRRNKWLTIIICIILAVTGQSVVRLLEYYYFLHRKRGRRYGVWTLGLLQVVGFPILIFPFLLLILLSSKKEKRPLIMTSNGISLKQLVITYPLIAIFMFYQATLSNIKLRISFRVFTLIYTTQLLLTPVFSPFFTKTKFNRWILISLVFAIITGAFTLYTFSAGSPVYRGKLHNFKSLQAALYATLFFSLLLCLVRTLFDSIRQEPTNRKQQPSFAVVLELLIVSSLLATVMAVAAVLLSGEHHDIKRRMAEFSKGETAYVWTLVGQAVAWQVYWVGIVGLVFAVSPIFSNVISVCTWPIVSLLVALFYNTYEQYHVLSGIALATAALSIASYFYMTHKDKSDGDGDEEAEDSPLNNQDPSS